jgi:uncharacterized iron-regulated membrane protein
MSGNVLNRKLHYWGSAIVAIPILAIIVTGLLLQMKKHWTWVQPVEHRGSVKAPAIELSDILKAIREHKDPSVSVAGWDDIKRLDVRPDRGVAKATLHNDYEVQVDLGTGRVMQVAYRRSDLIETIHDGSILGDWVKLGIVLPSALVLLFLWGSGIWMWVYPFLNRRKVRLRKAAAAARP